MQQKNVAYQIIRSSRKTISIQITPQGQVLVRCPSRMSDTDIRQFVRSKADWIDHHLSELRRAPALPPFTQEELRRLAEHALAVIPERTAHFAERMQVTYGRITIRNQRTRWGSCSSSGNLNFNCLLMLVPQEVLDYVIVHELCHRKEMNHSPKFWNEVSKVLPRYESSRKWLRENGGALIARLP